MLSSSFATKAKGTQFQQAVHHHEFLKHTTAKDHYSVTWTATRAWSNSHMLSVFKCWDNLTSLHNK